MPSAEVVSKLINSKLVSPVPRETDPSDAQRTGAKSVPERIVPDSDPDFVVSTVRCRMRK